MFKDKKEIDKINKEKSHSFLGNLLLQPTVNCTDSNRGQMFSGMILQCIQIENAEPPLVFTDFENQFGDYSSYGYKRLDGEFEVIKKFYKNKYNYLLLVKNVKTGEYDVVFRNECKHLTEKYGYHNKNDVIDSLQTGDIIEDEVLYRNNNYDDDMNFQYGTNLNTLFKILESNELWLTEWMCTNDKVEIQHGLEIVNNICYLLNNIDVLDKFHVSAKERYNAEFSFEKLR